MKTRLLLFFPILFVVITVRIVFYFLERGKCQNFKKPPERGKRSQLLLHDKRTKEYQIEEQVLGITRTNRKRDKTYEPENGKRIMENQCEQKPTPVSCAKLEISKHKPEKLISRKEKAPSTQWEEIEKRWAQIKNNDSCKEVEKILGTPTSIKQLVEKRELWVYVYGMKEKRTITFNCGYLEKTEIGENAFAKALIDLQAKKS